MSASSSVSSATPRRRTSRSALVRGGLVTVVVGAVVASAVFLVSSVLVDLRIPASPGGEELQTLTLPVVLAFTIVPIALGTIVYGLLRARVRPHDRVWTGLALGFGVLSIGGVVGIDAGTGNAIGLTALHLAVASVAAFLLPPAVRAAERRERGD